MSFKSIALARPATFEVGGQTRKLMGLEIGELVNDEMLPVWLISESGAEKLETQGADVKPENRQFMFETAQGMAILTLGWDEDLLAVAKAVSIACGDIELMEDVHFLDAQQMAEEHPDTFEAPSDALLASIRPGSLVKVCVEGTDPEDGRTQGERFWGDVVQVDGERLTLKVGNALMHPWGFDLDDEITVEKRNVYDVMKAPRNHAR